MNTEAFIGWDIGGAHLKMAHIDVTGRIISACQFPVPVWQGLNKLNNSLVEVKKSIPDKHASHSITTTAELSDIFQDRHSGLGEIVRIITAVIDKEPVRFYGGSAGWINTDRTHQFVREIASANWHATASFVATRLMDGILVDIGSTTTDIVPFRQGRILNQGYTDYERLSCYELVYTGIVRTPVMAIVNELSMDGKRQPVIPEHFATMADIYRLTGHLQEEDDMMPAADGAGKSVFESARRLARMLAVDIKENEAIHEWKNIAAHIANIQQEKIGRALQEVMLNAQISGPTLVGAGAGRFLVKQLADNNGYSYIDFADILDATDEIKPKAARSATAVAVAQLARQIT